MKGICCFPKFTKIKHKISNPEIRGERGEGVKRIAPSLGPPFVINTSFRHFELFCLFCVLNLRFLSCTFSFFQYKNYIYRTAAILKKYPLLDFRWLTCFFDKIVPKDGSYQISCLHHKLKDFKDNLLSYRPIYTEHKVG